MIEHPLSIFSSQNKENKGVAYLILGLTIYLLFFSKKSKPKIVNNPITLDNFKKRYEDILNDFPTDISAENFVNYVHSTFNEFYKINENEDAFLTYQDKSVPYFDLKIAQHMIYKIEQEFIVDYYDEKSEESLPTFPNTKSGQWLFKFLKRRYYDNDTFKSFNKINSDIFWVNLRKQISNDIFEINHYLEMLSRPDMSHARSIDFNKGTISDLIRRLNHVTSEIAERTRKKERLQLLEKQSPSEVFIQLDNGWKWVKIKTCENREPDEIEAKLMGHCGTPEWNNAFLISLRDQNNEPWVTATIKELYDNKFLLGQVKGRGNKTPPEKFSNQLFELFAKPEIIYHISNDNYDWTWHNFSPDKIQKLKKLKPYFFDSTKLPDYFPAQTLIDILKPILDTSAHEFYDDGKLEFYIESLDEYFDSEWWYEALENNYLDIEYDITQEKIAKWFKENLINNEKGKIIYNAIIKELEKEEIDVIPKNAVSTLKIAFHQGNKLAKKLEDIIYDSIEKSYKITAITSLRNSVEYYFNEILPDSLPDFVTIKYRNRRGRNIDFEFGDEINIYLVVDVEKLLKEMSLKDINEDTFSQIFYEAVSDSIGYFEEENVIDYTDEYSVNYFNENINVLLKMAKKILNDK
jgi:hypothetical protein